MKHPKRSILYNNFLEFTTSSNYDLYDTKRSFTITQFQRVVNDRFNEARLLQTIVCSFSYHCQKKTTALLRDIPNPNPILCTETVGL